MNRLTVTVLGYLLFLLGMLAIILGFIGLNLSPLSFIDENLNSPAAFAVKLGMVVVGFILFYMGRTPRE